MSRRQLLLANSHASGGGGGGLTFPIVLTTDNCKSIGIAQVCYKDMADDGAFYDALFQFLKDNTMYPGRDDYYDYESSEPILVIDNMEFYNIYWVEGDECITSSTVTEGKLRDLFIYNNGMVEVEKWR